MRFAFKEWAVGVDALGSGRQILILRKGGISEGRRGFQVEHAEFFLFPTFVHQDREWITPEGQARFDELIKLRPDPSLVRLEYFAHVISWRRLEDLASAERLRGQHIWPDALIAQRFDWGKDKNIHALAVRVFRLVQPIDLQVLPSYGGCKSWVDLEQDLSTEPAAPVLSAELFNEKLDLFHAALDVGNSAPPAEEPAP